MRLCAVCARKGRRIAHADLHEAKAHGSEQEGQRSVERGDDCGAGKRVDVVLRGGVHWVVPFPGMKKAAYGRYEDKVAPVFGP